MKFMRDICSKLMLAVLLFGVLWGAVSCNKLGPDGPADDFVANFRLTFAVPSDTKSTSTADYGDSANNEGTDNRLTANDIQVYFFDASGAFVASVTDFSDIRLTPVSSGSYDPHYHMYDAKMHVDGITGGTQYRVVVIANRRGTHASVLPFCVPKNDDWINVGTGSTDEQKLYSTLEFNYGNIGASGFNQYMSLNFGLDDRAYVPMWGFAQLYAQTVLGEPGYVPGVIPSSGTVEMLRAVAKVRINFSSELLDVATPGNVCLHNPVQSGYMTPPYAKVSGLLSTPNILNRDRVGGNPAGSFTNDWVNRGVSSAAGSEAVYPMYERAGSYYAYLPEAYIGQAWMELEFRWRDPALHDVTKKKTLHFADYEQASADLLGGKDIPLTDAQLLPYKFPVMRNHYYIYTITKLDPLELKFEVCEWTNKSTSISFN